VETHKIFADKLLDLAKHAKFEKTMTSIWQVPNNLPDILKSKIGKSHTNWIAFCILKDTEILDYHDLNFSMGALQPYFSNSTLFSIYLQILGSSSEDTGVTSAMTL
jgi:hypothetical protein